MPPTFVYMMALLVWVPIACLVWLVAAIMALRKASRQTARSLALATAGTFPGVFVFQIVAAPLVAAIGVANWLVWKTLEPGSSTMSPE